MSRDTGLRGSWNSDLVFAVAVAVWWGERLQWNEDIAEQMLVADDLAADMGRSEITGY